MDATTAQRLTELTSDFYARVVESFSATRARAWPGWERMLAEVCLNESEESLRVLDLACGNLRFERYLVTALPTRRITAVCVDECDAMADPIRVSDAEIRYVHCDVIGQVRTGASLQKYVGYDYYDFAVCFGFMHHLPLVEYRAAVLQTLLESVRPGGHVAVSFWEPGKSPKLAEKARRITAEQSEALGLKGLGPNDYLLDWQGHADALRYCHDFTEAEIDALIHAVEPCAREVARFSADGRTGNLNRYLVLRRL